MSSIIDLKEIKRYEVTEVYAQPDATVDIVLVHGLNGHPWSTWTANNGCFWPSQLLPATLKQAKARVLVYGYNADVYVWGSDGSASSDYIHQHAQTLINALAMERKSEEKEENAIIWVAHSLGGILVKRALELSNDLTSKSSDPIRSIYVSTYGIIFLGTPHTGADPAKWGQILQSIASTMIPKKILDTEPHLLQTLKANNETLQNINLHFLDIYQRFEVDMVHEAMKTDLKGTKAFIVDQIAASPPLPGVRYYGIEATHSGMCKFESKNSPGYLNVAGEIKGWVAECPPRITSRWAAERKARQQVRENEAKEILGIFEHPPSQHQSATSTPALSNSAIISTSMIHSIASIEPEKPSETYFLKPPGFRPNSLFVGRESELAEMHKMLFDKRRRAEGVAAVLLQSLPGGGKTHLARQYVYSHLNDFPGGVFWVSAKSQELLAAGFWDIARKVALKQSQDELSSSQDPQHFISIVNNWFSTNHEWLLVLDGIHFEDSEDLRRFIPDSTNSSLIYTSTERDVAGDYEFMNPHLISIAHLSAREAQELFLLELDKKLPTTDDRKHALELVRRMDFLPLVIHAVAKRLKATGEPLAKFARTYASGPKLRDLDTYVSVVKELEIANANGALNLVRILCFLSQHIPVELIILGLKALDIPVKSYESVNGLSLDNTFKILNRFALITRSELEDTPESSQNSKASRDMLADDLDVIKLHSVVQDFFIDSLRAAGELPLWLGRATSLLLHSYEMANTRIKRKSHAGLVGDYRNYEVHITRLLYHLTQYEKKSPPLPAIRAALEVCAHDIKEQVNRRTRQSSKDIADGRSDAFQTSIFDRTSSSSDAELETLGHFEKHFTDISKWGTEMSQIQVESPVKMDHEPFSDPLEPHTQQLLYPSYPMTDGGYASDMEDSYSMTVAPSQRTERPDIMPDDNGGWQVVRGRQRPRRKPPRQVLHRTTRMMENNRYRDSAGAWRAINPTASDPRITHELAQGVINRVEARRPSRGRTSGQSQAEVALHQINKNSPPPTRGGGFIRNRRQSPQKRPALLDSNGHLLTGRGSYSSPISGYSYDVRASAASPGSSRGKASPQSLQATPAMASLQGIPYVKDVPTLRPIPNSPRGPYRQSYPVSDSAINQIPSIYTGDNYPAGANFRTYPLQAGPLPVEYIAGASSSLKRDQPHEALVRNSSYLSFPGLQQQRSEFSPYYAGNFTDDYNNGGGGYTSQPMSRVPSGQSEQGRRPSLAETEPAPELPTFSPRIQPTSYQIFEQMRERGEDGRVRKSPRLGFVRAAQIESLNDWVVPPAERENKPPQQSLNASAAIFSPRSHIQPPLVPPQMPSRYAAPYLTPYPPVDIPVSAPLMAPSTSGGLLVGRRIIEFGDFPEPVNFDLARERLERQRADVRAFDEGLFRGRREIGIRKDSEVMVRVPRGGSDLRPEELVADEERGGRRRGLSSPETAVGLGFAGNEYAPYGVDMAQSMVQYR